ncbi:MAG TPA: hypothetical protein VMH02_04810 [Verrucomicrobiae bacterium]|nr:hypothetical protein [Verrucomicrobiae bacterium]
MEQYPRLLGEKYRPFSRAASSTAAIVTSTVALAAARSGAPAAPVPLPPGT